jgi:hypothetical protein
VTLSTNVYVLDEVSPHELFRFCQTLLTKYDEDGGYRPWNQQRCSDKPREDWNGETWTKQGRWSIANQIGQGLPAILDITYHPGGPLTTAEQAEMCTGHCEPDDDYHYHPHACWLDIDFDTAYGYKDERGWGCGDLHAALVAELGEWLDAKGVRWEWRNEYTGEVHGGDDRYVRLIDLGVGGFEASAWFRTTVLPAIAADIANRTEGER